MALTPEQRTALAARLTAIKNEHSNASDFPVVYTADFFRKIRNVCSTFGSSELLDSLDSIAGRGNDDSQNSKIRGEANTEIARVLAQIKALE